MKALIWAVVALLVASADAGAASLTRTTVVVADRSASLAFYRDALSFEVVYEGPYSGSTFHQLFNLDEEAEVYFVILQSPSPDSAMVGLLEVAGGNLAPSPPAKSSPLRFGETVLWFTTQDLDGDYQRLQQLGVQIIAAPFETSGGREMVVADPDGVRLYLFQKEPIAAD